MDGKQTPPPPPPPAPNIPNYIFTPTFPPATTLPPPQLHPNIDWDILLSCPNRPNYDIVQTHPTTLDSDYVALTSQSGIINIDDDDDGEYQRRRRRSNGGRMRRTSSRTPRFEFQTRSEDDVLDDGYRWRKYGQKSVKNTIHPRSYYRCTHHTCNVKKQVQRLAEDNTIVVTTYDGIHNHPSEKLMETLTPLLNQMQFLSNFT